MRLFRLRSSIDISLRRSAPLIAAGLFSALLASCGGGGGGGGPPTYTVSATVSNLQPGTSVILLNDGANSLTVSANGTVAFSTPVASGGGYSVTVATQPTGQTCTAAMPAGTVTGSNVNVAVSCVLNSYRIGGMVSGLTTGNSVVLQDNQANNTTITSNGTFSFSTPVLSTSAYSVSILTQPAGETCTVSQGDGTVTGQDISSVVVQCVAHPFTFSVTVIGLANVAGLTLSGTESLAVSTSGTYTSPSPILSGSTYTETISTQPAGHTCFVEGGISQGLGPPSTVTVSGTVGTSNVNVQIFCPWHVGYALWSQGVLGYYIDQATGMTTPLAANPVKVGRSASAIAASPGTPYLYVVDQVDGGVEELSIDPVSGALRGIWLGGIPVESAPGAVAVAGNGKFVYVANHDSGTISAFTVNSSTGVLTSVSSPYSVGDITQLAVDSTGRYLFAVSNLNTLTPLVTSFLINAATGELILVAGGPFPIAAPGNMNFSATAFAVDPAAGFLFVGFTNKSPLSAGAVAVESITGGVPAPVMGSPFATGGGPGVGSFAIDPAGKFLYIGDQDADYIVGMRINSSTGVLSPLPSSPVNLGVFGPPVLGSIDPSGTFLYSTNAYSPYTINATTGALTPFSYAAIPSSVAVPVAFSSTP